MESRRTRGGGGGGVKRADQIAGGLCSRPSGPLGCAPELEEAEEQLLIYFRLINLHKLIVSVVTTR